MTMPQQATDHYLQPYRNAEVDHGSDFRVTLWANERSQRLRFRVMTEMVFLAGKRVLDVGSSRGDFAAYLQEAGFAYEQYVGIDGVEPVIDFARQRDLPRARFEVGDVVTDPSWLSVGDPQVIAISGTLNTMPDEMAIELLDHAWQAAGQTLVFNFLSDTASPKAPTQTEPARRLPMLRLLEWAMSRTSQVAMRQDYFRFGHDATIAMRKV